MEVIALLAAKVHIFPAPHATPKNKDTNRKTFKEGSKMIICSTAAGWPSGSPTRVTASTGLTEALSTLCSPRTSASTFSPLTSAGTYEVSTAGIHTSCLMAWRKQEIRWSPKQVWKWAKRSPRCLTGDVVLAIIITVNTGRVVYLWYTAGPHNPGLILPHSGMQAFIWGMEIYSQALDPADCCPDILEAFRQHQRSRLFSRQRFIVHAVAAVGNTNTGFPGRPSW